MSSVIESALSRPIATPWLNASEFIVTRIADAQMIVNIAGIDRTSLPSLQRSRPCPGVEQLLRRSRRLASNNVHGRRVPLPRTAFIEDHCSETLRIYAVHPVTVIVDVGV